MLLPARRAALRAGSTAGARAGMSRPQSRIVTEAAQTYSFSRRALVLGAAQGGVGAGARRAHGAGSRSPRTSTISLLSESNRVNLTLMPPRRGWIVDRNGEPIANNRTDFRVDIIPDRLAGQGPRARRRCTTSARPAARGDRRGSATDLEARRGLPAGAGRRKSRLGAIRRGQRAPARTARRRADARLCAQLSGRRGGRRISSAMSARPRPSNIKKTKDPLLRHARLQDRQGRPRKDAREPSCAASPAPSASR